ncbi:hypothetical protein [Pseudomonas sp.]
MQILKRIIKWVLQMLATAAAREAIVQGLEVLKQILDALNEE